MYSDETGIDDNEVPDTGWAPKGQRCYAKKRCERKKRYNIIAALNSNVVFASFIFEGHSNSSIYEIYVERILAPSLKSGMVVIIDNASFHKSKKTIELIENAGCRVIFLPPYSPDFNPIEHYWAAIKNKIRRAGQAFDNFLEAAVNTLADLCPA